MFTKHGWDSGLQQHYDHGLSLVHGTSLALDVRLFLLAWSLI